MRVLYLDCFSGISGDMALGALCDLGLQPSTLEWELSKLDLGDFHMHFERDERQHITGMKFTIHEGVTHQHEPESPERSHDEDAAHGDEIHEHEHGGHEHHEHSPSRAHADIRALIERSDLSTNVKQRSLAIFERIARAEGKIHGIAPEDVHFHEIGALDSIADIVGFCVAIEQLGIEKIFSSPLQEGRGWVRTAHGKFPVPAPASLEILAGIRIEGAVDVTTEMITPTGAAILAEFSESFGPMPTMRIEKTGYGIGSRNLASRPNVLRAVLGTLDSQSADYERDTITRIETNLDDTSPELIGAAIEKLFAAGALDVFLTPIQMKKNRPATLLTVLCEISALDAIASVIFRETTSFGLRTDRVERLKLSRRIATVETAFGKIAVKIGTRAGEILQVAPEFESCRTASETSGQPLREIYEAAMRAYRAESELAP